MQIVEERGQPGYDGPTTRQCQGKRQRFWAGCRKCVAHRWMRVFFFGAAVTLTSCLYAGWQQYSLILLKGGKYSWLCGPGSITNMDNGFESCEEQDQAVGRLFAVASALELLGAIFAGVALDRLGPRLTGFMGEALGFVAMVMMVISRKGLNLLPLSMVVTGVAINLIAFPALILEDYFPSAAATTAAFVVSCQCLSCAIAPIIWEVWKFFPHWSFVGIWTTYLLAVWIPVSFFYVLTLPRTREIQSKSGPSETVAAPPDERSSPVEIDMLPSRLEEAQLPTPPPPSLRAACFSLDFAVMNLINMILMLQTAYYQVVVRSISGPAISDFVGWGLPTQAIWGLILGRIVDFIKTPAMAGIIFIGYAATYLMVQLPRGYVQYGTASLFLFFMSYAFTIKYSYIQERFPTQLFGRLLGVAGGLGGGAVLLTNLLVGSLTITFWCNFLATLSVIGIILSSYLALSMKRLHKRMELKQLAEFDCSNLLSTPLLSSASTSPAGGATTSAESLAE
eukprot:Gregarina_sp_Pseudo_9__5781@NODE_861_length_2123_cov_96_050864_g809_i0_p1_GENE_NODE_861_length_2123_cov_96_050864_g809_i0NODE_861_length_2123_cov_96_050864_g809_i0_p1_ORF_typecomplete_len508_score68_55MFS_1/PF07690_16/2_3e02MFS_1/PF07690_16/2_3e07MFS_1/PF07690_16/2_5Nodulinlike/PF06813_13/2e05Nodulinlike/PF06813_13/2_9e02Sugar_tr/PF00083_24/0_021UPF0060/PF02694_15/0_021UPF0060/PF02694_15/2_4e03UPF0060/PF02694_15/2_2e03MFS_3/PF05977_13/1_4e03MFS_3/PF05977_13/0_075_NODE_861_length_2123_cov_96_0508